MKYSFLFATVAAVFPLGLAQIRGAGHSKDVRQKSLEMLEDKKYEYNIEFGSKISNHQYRRLLTKTEIDPFPKEAETVKKRKTSKTSKEAKSDDAYPKKILAPKPSKASKEHTSKGSAPKPSKTSKGSGGKKKELGYSKDSEKLTKVLK
ncbi:hypothetical protein IV203_021838 [Nitzschia inconspicua]|uniref:Uncharacterized protein n=1 Tax=Nitzschia inconspicua TaxID=303405 RepID=A0A9K3KIG7_9STRA|nr:hypothetical protein IV203_033456 [Nitzschia inconspicua]KAG7343830.1 hypothetical protein IV203_021838 [Nitzschia inconspicua]